MRQVSTDVQTFMKQNLVPWQTNDFGVTSVPVCRINLNYIGKYADDDSFHRCPPCFSDLALFISKPAGPAPGRHTVSEGTTGESDSDSWRERERITRPPCAD